MKSGLTGRPFGATLTFQVMKRIDPDAAGSMKSRSGGIVVLRVYLAFLTASPSLDKSRARFLLEEAADIPLLTTR
jgi:hypothetical protein